MRTPIDETNAGAEASRNQQRSNFVESRREFLKSAIAAAAVVGAGSQAWTAVKRGNALSRPGAERE